MRRSDDIKVIKEAILTISYFLGFNHGRTDFDLHYVEALIKRLGLLVSNLEKKQEEKEVGICLDNHNLEIKNLKDKLRIATDCLAVYADEGNWRFGLGQYTDIRCVFYSEPHSDFRYGYTGYHSASEAIRKIGEIK